MKENQEIKTVSELVRELGIGAGIGEKLMPGDEITITEISFAQTRFGEVAVFETAETGKRFSGAVAIVQLAHQIPPECLPVRARVEEMVSESGRTYQVLL